MDCYSEYKYNHYQQQQHNIHHIYYNNNPSARFGNTTASDNHHHTPPPSPFYDGFSRHSNNNNLHHASGHSQPPPPPPAQTSPYHLHSPSHGNYPLPSHGNYPLPFDASSESASQFYYPSAHPAAGTTPPGYSYGSHHLSNHHPYDSFRSARSNYRSYNYGYHNNLHYPPQPPPPSAHHHQQQQQQQPSPHFQGHFYSQYNGNLAADRFSHYPNLQQQQSPSIDPGSNQHQQGDLRSSEPQPTLMKNGEHETESSDKSVTAERSESSLPKEERRLTEGEREAREKSVEVKPNEKSTSESGKSSSTTASSAAENLNVESGTGEGEPEKRQQQPINNNNNDNNNNNSSVEGAGEQEVAKNMKNNSLNETNNEHCKENRREDTSVATDYSSEARVNSIHRDGEKFNPAATTTAAPTAPTSAATAINLGGGCIKLSEHSTSNPHNFNDRSSTPIAKLSAIGYNHHYNNNNMESSRNYPPPKHHRYPMSPWYSHDYYNNWILNPDDRRHFPDSHSFFSSMRNSKKNHLFHPSLSSPSLDKQHKAQHDTTSPSTNKRTKRKAKVEEPALKKQEPSKELIKNLTPLPGFLQTFGQTEIGRFSEAFYISSDSPHYHESDVDSPQPYDFDSLDGPIPRSFYMCGSENDSPMSNFSEIMCKDF